MGKCMKEYVGIDIGGTKCAVVRADEGGKVVEKIRFDTVGFKETLDKIIDGVNKLKTPITECVGISCGGPLDSVHGVVLSPPNLPGWDDVPITKIVKDRTGLDASLCNDANACALAEWMYGAGRGTKNMVFLTFGTGMGAGLILDGRLYEGTLGLAGEVGHLRLAQSGPVGFGKAGSFEGFCSGGGIARLARQMALDAIKKGAPPSYCESAGALISVTAKSVAEAAYAGDKTAKAVYRKSGDILGRGLALIIDMINPEVIVIGSVFARAETLLRPPMERSLEREAIGASLGVCKIVPAALGDSIGDIAAVSVARYMKR